MSLFLLPSVLALSFPAMILFLFLHRRGKKLSLPRRSAALLGSALLPAMAWVTFRNPAVVRLPEPQGTFHAPARLLEEPPAGTWKKPTPSKENTLYLVQLFAVLPLEDGLHPAAAGEALVPWPEGEGVPCRIRFHVMRTEISCKFYIQRSPNHFSLLEKIPAPLCRAIKVDLEARGPGVSSYGGPLEWYQAEGTFPFWTNSWGTSPSSLERNLALLPKPDLQGRILLSITPLRKEERLVSLPPAKMKTYLDLLVKRGFPPEENKKGEEYIPPFPDGIELDGRIPGAAGLFLFIPATGFLLAALVLVSQAFRRRIPALLVMVFLSLLLLAAEDRALLRRNLAVLKDKRVPLTERILAGKGAEFSFFFRDTAAEAGKKLAADPDLPEPLQKAAATLGRIFRESRR